MLIDVAFSLAEITECLPGAEVDASAADQSLLLSIVGKMDGATATSRILALKFVTKDQRNMVLSGLRYHLPPKLFRLFCYIIIPYSLPVSLAYLLERRYSKAYAN